MKSVNIATIAQEAGVSQTTVSRVLNNSGYVSTDTRDKVNRVIEKYGYTPSALARGLHSGQSDIIGVLIPEIENPFFGELLKIISLEAEKHSLSMICFNSDNNGEKDLRALETMKQYRVRGLILWTVSMLLSFFLTEGYPFMKMQTEFSQIIQGLFIKLQKPWRKPVIKKLQ